MTVVSRWPAVVGLALVWVLLWGTFTPLSILGGVVVGAGVTALFPMPSAGERLPFRPLRVPALVAYLLRDLGVSAVEVSWQVLRRGREACGAIVEVPLFTTSDRIVAVMANALSLSPGTMVLQIDHEHDRWYVYSLGPRDRAEVDRARRRMMDMQRLVLRALGTPEEIAAAERRMRELAR